MKHGNSWKAAAIGALLATALAASPAVAQTRLGPDEAVATAMVNNEGLKRAALALEAKRRALGLAWNSLLPSLTAGAGLAQSGSGAAPHRPSPRPALSRSA